MVVKSKKKFDQHQLQERVEEKVTEFIVNRLNLPIRPEEINREESFLENNLGLDSVDALELVVGVKEEFKVDIPEDIDPTKFVTVKSIAKYIIENIPKDKITKYI